MSLSSYCLYPSLSIPTAMRQALKLDGRDGHSWLLLARTQERLGEIGAARAVFKRVRSVLRSIAVHSCMLVCVCHFALCQGNP